MRVQYPKLQYGLYYLLLNVFTASKGSQFYFYFILHGLFIGGGDVTRKTCFRFAGVYLIFFNIFSNEFFNFCFLKSLYIAWASFRTVM